jgi:hypothetical protein
MAVRKQKPEIIELAEFKIPEVKSVLWKDHNSIDSWQDPTDYKPSAIIVISTGFVVYEDDDIISLANSYNENDGFCCIINILKCCVVS